MDRLFTVIRDACFRGSRQQVTAVKDKCGEMPLEVSDSLVSLSSPSLFRVASLANARLSRVRHSFQTAPDIHRARNFEKTLAFVALKEHT